MHASQTTGEIPSEIDDVPNTSKSARSPGRPPARRPVYPFVRPSPCHTYLRIHTESRSVVGCSMSGLRLRLQRVVPAPPDVRDGGGVRGQSDGWVDGKGAHVGTATRCANHRLALEAVPLPHRRRSPPAQTDERKLLPSAVTVATAPALLPPCRRTRDSVRRAGVFARRAGCLHPRGHGAAWRGARAAVPTSRRIERVNRDPVGRRVGG